MKKRWLAVLVCLFMAVCLQALSETGEVTVQIMKYNNGGDHQSMGYIEETVFSVAEGKSVRINMSEVFDMYPSHTGIYGYLYAPGNVTLTAGEKQVSGSGVVEFAFPGAQSLTATGTGKVYAYFLPVPYMRLSPDAAAPEQNFDTQWLTETAVGHYNMFMLADPHVLVYQEAIPYVYTVYKNSFTLGPLPQQYQYMDHGGDGSIFYAYVSERPVLVQCDAIRRDIYDTDSFFARKMARASTGNGYEIWAYQNCETHISEAMERIGRVFDECMQLADEEFYVLDIDFDPIVMVVLGDEIANMGAAGVAFNDNAYDKIGYRSFVFVDGASWEHSTAYMEYLFAHEIGHIVQARTLTNNSISFSHWFQEGFATFFGEKVSARLGGNYRETGSLTAADGLDLQKFENNLVFGADDFESFKPMSDAGTLDIAVHNPYMFGRAFMEYLEEKYGVGFFKKISRTFYNSWYKGHENRFFYRRNDLDYNVDKYYEMIRAGLGTKVFLNFPAYAEKKYGIAAHPVPDVVLPAGLKEIGEEAFMGIAAKYVSIPEGVEQIGDKAFFDCPNLKIVQVPATADRLGEYLFGYHNHALTIFGVEGSAGQAYANAMYHTFVPWP